MPPHGLVQPLDRDFFGGWGTVSSETFRSPSSLSLSKRTPTSPPAFALHPGPPIGLGTKLRAPPAQGPGSGNGKMKESNPLSIGKDRAGVPAMPGAAVTSGFVSTSSTNLGGNAAAPVRLYSIFTSSPRPSGRLRRLQASFCRGNPLWLPSAAATWRTGQPPFDRLRDHRGLPLHGVGRAGRPWWDVSEIGDAIVRTLSPGSDPGQAPTLLPEEIRK